MDVNREPKHWRDPSSDTASRMEYKIEGKSSVLKIHNVKAEDSGRYKCRVDYHLEQTSFQLVDLNVIIPPGPPTILYQGKPVVGNKIQVKENQSITLVCESIGKILNSKERTS